MASAIAPNQARAGGQTMKEVAARIEPASQAAGPLKMVVYGPNKQGKTHYSGSSDLKTLIVDCRDEGTETLADRPNVDVYKVKDYTDLDGVFWYLHGGDHPYEVVSLDTITMLSVITMKWVLGDRSKDAMADPLIPEMRQWNKVTQALENIILNWRDLPVHMLFLAQEKTFTYDDENGEGQVHRIGPWLSPQAQKTLLSAVGTIGRVYTKEVPKEGKMTIEHRMLLGPHSLYESGTRIRRAPRVMRDPTLAKLLDLRSKTGEARPQEIQEGE